MNVEEQRFLEEMEQARVRETQPGDAHEEQISTEEDLTLAEQGLIEPGFFFEILPQWSTLVKFDATYFIAQMNKDFQKFYTEHFGLH